jgi:hypothetical protein
MAGGETRRKGAAQTVTDQDADDPSQVVPLLDQTDGRIGRVTADNA